AISSWGSEDFLGPEDLQGESIAPKPEEEPRRSGHTLVGAPHLNTPEPKEDDLSSTPALDAEAWQPRPGASSGALSAALLASISEEQDEPVLSQTHTGQHLGPLTGPLTGGLSSTSPRHRAEPPTTGGASGIISPSLLGPSTTPYGLNQEQPESYPVLSEASLSEAPSGLTGKSLVDTLSRERARQEAEVKSNSSMVDEDALWAALRTPAPAPQSADRSPRRLFFASLLLLSLVLVGWWFTRTPTTSLNYGQINFEGGRYLIEVKASASPSTELEAPLGSYFVEENGAHPQSLEIDGAQELLLSFPKEGLSLGENQLDFAWQLRDGARLSRKSLVLYYHLSEAAPLNQKGEYRFTLSLAEGWRLLQSNARIRPAEASTELTQLYLKRPRQRRDGSSAPLIVDLTLEGPQGQRQGFSAQRITPKSPLPLEIFTPLKGWARARDRVRISGRTAPETKIQLAGSHYQSNSQGLFDFVAPLPEEGTQRLTLSFSTGGYEFKEETLTLERLSKEESARRQARVNATKERLKRSYPRRAYRQLLRGNPRQALRAQGTVGWVHRQLEGPQLALLFLCKAACPLWVDLPEGQTVDVGDRLWVFGKLTAPRRFSRTGESSLKAPSLKAKLIAVKP
ncbi:MAG: hypothetical protein VYD19_05190, partial [Myxococcota bacterium]|nr:hypothetical protein [Myxococcota bacterium]